MDNLLKAWKECLIVVLCLVVIWSLTSNLDTNPEAVSHLSLGSTLISIVLSVIAILHTLYQSTAQSSQADRLTNATFQLLDSTSKIGTAVIDLRDVGQQASQISDASARLREDAEKFGEAIKAFQDLKDQMAISIQKALNQELVPFREDFGKWTEQIAGKVAPGNLTKALVDWETVVQRSSKQGLLFVYAAIKKQQFPVRLTVEELIAQVNLAGGRLSSRDYVVGFLVGLSTAGVLPQVKFEDIEPDFRPPIPEELSRLVLAWVEAHDEDDSIAPTKKAIDDVILPKPPEGIAKV